MACWLEKEVWGSKMPLYFGYGSNMDGNQLRERCLSAKFRKLPQPYIDKLKNVEVC